MKLKLFWVFFLLYSCSSPPKKFTVRDPIKTLTEICHTGMATTEVKGRVSLNAKTARQSGNFSGVVRVDPNKLILQIQNLFGGTEAEVLVDDDNYRVNIVQKNETVSGERYWMGIPLFLAKDLFLGRPLCIPKIRNAVQKGYLSKSWIKKNHLEVISDGEDLVVRDLSKKGTKKSQIVYSLIERDGLPLLDHIVWTYFGIRNETIELRFSNFEGRVARQFDVHSSKGEVSVHWKTRKQSQ